jgi:hypothetical protein
MEDTENFRYGNQARSIQEGEIIIYARHSQREALVVADIGLEVLTDLLNL